jgi:diaminohydroxyphosphoribosylaminopyrimidine deaminase/5-amino-6-(5-phosphoribosylamino)uracil reductase
MSRALALAAGAMGRTSPNPAVGAVIVDPDGVIVGEGATGPYGHAHAEPVALAMAGHRARGATLYVTLEPCSHHGNTPPCADAIVEAGVIRVVVATRDPNPRVAGRGVARLQASGIAVEVGLGADTARTLMAGFATWIARRRPNVIAKFAASLDGRTATRTGDSRWISGREARRWAHGVRDHVDAIMVGIGTVLADDPALTSRQDVALRIPAGDGDAAEERTDHFASAHHRLQIADPLLGGIVAKRSWEVGETLDTHGSVQPERQPLRIILDTHLRTPLTSQVASGSLHGTTLIVAVDDGTRAWAARRDRLTSAARNVEVATTRRGVDGRPDAASVLDLLGARNLTTLLVEGGATIHDAFFRAGLVDRVAAVVAPMVIGGGPSAVGTASSGPARLTDALRLHERTVTVLGDDILVTGWLRHPTWLD